MREIGVKSARNDLEREREGEMREDLCALRFFYGRKYSVILSTSESITLVDKQRYLACAGVVVFGDLGIFHAASTGGTSNSKQ